MVQAAGRRLGRKQTPRSVRRSRGHGHNRSTISATLGMSSINTTAYPINDAARWLAPSARRCRWPAMCWKVVAPGCHEPRQSGLWRSEWPEWVECEFGDLTSRHSIGVQPRTSSSEVDLSLATRDTNVSFRQQLTPGSARSKGSTQSSAAVQPCELGDWSWPRPCENVSIPGKADDLADAVPPAGHPGTVMRWTARLHALAPRVGQL